MCLIFGILKTIDSPFRTNGKLMVLGILILKHFRVLRQAVLHGGLVSCFR